jgi:16S rRNA (adenine1518-N6/adenine1519-N6)-dimethyltransferase
MIITGIVTLQTQSTIRSLLADAGFKPNKKLGQHFLIDGNLMRKLVAAAEIGPTDVVLEVGCGTGSLTEELAGVAGMVIAIELDRGLAGLAASQLAGLSNVKLIHRDVLASKSKIEPEVLEALRSARQQLAGKGMLVANLPYQVASPLIMDLLIDSAEVEGMCVTVQKEVGDRLVADAGGKDYGPLTVIVQALADVHRIAAVPPQAFWPRPAVESVMLRIDPVPQRRQDVGDVGHFAAVVKSSFLHRRKMLAHSLSATYGRNEAERVLDEEGIEPRARPEQIIPKRWIELARRLD